MQLQAWEEDAAVLIARCKRRNDVLRTENMRLHAALDALAQGREVRACQLDSYGL